MAEAKKASKETVASTKVKQEAQKDGTTKENNRPKSQTSNQAEVAESKAEPKMESVAESPLKAASGKVAKAGKRSTKSLRESAEKQAREDRKATADDPEAATKAKPAPKTRSLLERRGKKFKQVAKLVDSQKDHNLKEGLELVVKTSPVKFDATVELHVRLNVDPRHADQNIRDNLTLPSGTGKKIKIAVFADNDDAAAATKAGADLAGTDSVIKLLDKGQTDFDVLIATPAMMAKLGKYARVLGPKGLMPNPKSGTVTTDVAKAVTEAKAGRVEYRVDSTGIVHLGVGKVSFGVEKLQANVDAVMASIRANKPAGVKGVYIKSIFLTTSMGPSIRLSVN